MEKTVTSNSPNKKKTKTEEYLEAAGNDGLSKFVQGNATGGANYKPMPEGATREEQDVINAWQSAYNNAVSIENNALQAKLNANKAHELATKYLAVQNKANGLDGLGIADTSALRLSSQYQQALADANSAKTNALQENYAQMNEDVNTIRGEWASQEEAKAQAKLSNVEAAIMSGDDETKVKKYLDAMGYTEGTQERSYLMETWNLAFGEGEGQTTVPTISNELASKYNIDAEKEPFKIDHDTTTEQILSKLPVAYGGRQNTHISRILDLTKDNMIENGTYVDFNFGATGGRTKEGTIFVFYDDTWYPTKYSRAQAQALLKPGENYFEEGENPFHTHYLSQKK